MNLTQQEKQELNTLSKKVFGTTSKWEKLVNKGDPEPHTRQREVMLPDGRGGLKTKVFTDTKYVLKHYTVEEVKKLMLDVLASRVETPPQMPSLGGGLVQPIPDGSTVTMPDGSTATVSGSTVAVE